ncbi:unnamed protein product [Mytilus coruscus]|uniref:Ig-like domain-containing protein n=1 Tax=Mytilus coruscus TaxID=42192 RepID=A0A6J8F162_MYTCO|nr:unnamed protein product [Mytilus coruscus]
MFNATLRLNFSTEICLLLLMFVNGTQCTAWDTVYTTPGSYLQLNITDLEESIHCFFLSEGQQIENKIVYESQIYDTQKYQLTTNKRPSVVIKAPQEIGSFSIGVHIIELGRNKLHITDRLLSLENETYGRDGSQIDLMFTLNTTKSLSGQSLHFDEDAVKYYFQFALNIKNASTKDDGIYKCLVATPWIDIVVAHAPAVEVVARRHSFDCVAKGFPHKYTFNNWEHQSEEGEHIRFLDGLHYVTLNLQNHQLKYQISGRYICTVSNGIPDVNGSLLQKGFKSMQYTGAPIFPPENRNVKLGVLGQPLILSFVLYSNPFIEDLWIEGATDGDFQNITKSDFKISNTTLLYTAFGNKGNISGYEIIFGANILRSNDFHKYNLWTKNELGVDFYRFEIIEIDSLKTISKDITGFIISSGIAAVLLFYIIVNRIRFKVNERLLRSRQRSSADLHYHTYDEIGSISNQEVNIIRLAIDQQGSSQQTRIISSSQTRGTQTDINNQLTLNYTTEAPSAVSTQECSEDTGLQNVTLEATIDVSSPLYTEDIRHSFRTYDAEAVTSSDGSGHNQYEDWSISNGTSRCSTDSTESNMCSLNPTSFNINVGDGYENPYQIIMQESQDNHQYSSISNQSFQFSGDQEMEVRGYVFEFD